MIVITDVKIVEADYDIYQYLISNNKKSANYLISGSVYEETEISVENINGRRFINVNGEEVVIGMDKASQDLIGLPFSAFEDQSNFIRSLTNKNSKLTSHLKIAEGKLLKFENLNNTEKLKFVLFNDISASFYDEFIKIKNKVIKFIRDF